MLVGYFEGLDSERGMAWRAADSLGMRSFLGLGLDERGPDHSTISRTRRLIDVETHQKVFGWVLERLAEAGLVKGKRWWWTVRLWKQTRDAEHRAARHGPGVPGVLDASGEGGGDPHADSRSAGEAGSAPQEEGLERGMEEPFRS
jgi:Transposase domain (DUF772)